MSIKYPPLTRYLAAMATAMPDLVLATMEERHKDKAKTRHDFEAVAKAVAKRLRKLEAKRVTMNKTK